MPDFAFEDALAARGFGRVAGVDEAGRGPLAGPVAAAAVILPRPFSCPRLDDSKKLTKKCRELLYAEITEPPPVVWAVEMVEKRGNQSRGRGLGVYIERSFTNGLQFV